MTGADVTRQADGRGLWCALLAMGMGLAVGGCARPAAAPEPWPAGPRVIAVTDDMVAVSAGVNDGVRKGVVLEVRRDGEPVAKLRVEAVSPGPARGSVPKSSRK